MIKKHVSLRRRSPPCPGCCCRWLFGLAHVSPGWWFPGKLYALSLLFYLFFNTANWLDQIPMVLEITFVWLSQSTFSRGSTTKLENRNLPLVSLFRTLFFCFSNFFAKLAVVLAKSLVGWRKLHENARTHTRSKTDFFTEKPHFWPCLGLLDLHVFFARVLLPEYTITIYYRGKGGGSTNAILVYVVEHTHTLGQTEIVTLQLYCLRG